MPPRFLEARAAGSADRWELSLSVEESKGRRTGIVVDDGDSVLGYAVVGRNVDDDLPPGLLYDFYLHPSAWGTGAAKVLMEWSIEMLRHLGYHDAVLWVLEANPRARWFYEREGWRTDGRQRSIDYGGTELVALCYRTEL